jgi:hypothetical protein
MGEPAKNLTKRRLANHLDKLRKALARWASNYNSFLRDASKDQLECDPQKVKELWIGLAQEGRRLYRTFFNIQGGEYKDEQLATWGQRIKAKKGDRLTIDSPIGHLPWGLFYDEEIPEHLGDDYIEVLLRHFWATSYELDILPDYPDRSAEWDTTLDNRAATRLTLGVNESVKGGYGLRQVEFFEGILQNSPSYTMSRRKKEFLDSITRREEPQHLIYLFCHHRKGDTWSVDDYRDLSDSKIILHGDDDGEEADGVITLTELEDNERIRAFKPPCPPVTFINGCGSSQVEIGDPTSFMFYFVNVLESQAFLGTEAVIPAAFADAFGQRFVRDFLSGRRIGDILSEERVFFAREYNNPFGLYYTLYGNGNICLTKAIAGQGR